MTLDGDLDDEPGLDDLSKTELAELEAELGETKISSPQRSEDSDGYVISEEISETTSQLDTTSHEQPESELNQTDQSETRITEARLDEQSDSVEFVKSEIIASSISESDNMPKNIDDRECRGTHSPSEESDESHESEEETEDITPDPEPKIIENLVREALESSVEELNPKLKSIDHDDSSISQNSPSESIKDSEAFIYEKSDISEDRDIIKDELKTPTEIKTPEDLKTPDFTVGKTLLIRLD